MTTYPRRISIAVQKALGYQAAMGPTAASANMSRTVFEEEVVPLGRPVLMKGLVADWPCVGLARTSPKALLGYLERHDAGVPLSTYVGAPEIGGRFFYNSDVRTFNFDRGTAAFAAVARLLLEGAAQGGGPAIYAGAASATDHFPGFAHDNPMPLLDPAVMPRLWIGNATTISTHYDVADNIACVAAGHRRFTLFPPDQVGNLYVGPLEHTISGQPVSMVDPRAPDLDRYPRFAAARDAALVFDLEPGDALYVPSLWWHHVEALDSVNLLVNYWWSTPHQGSAFEVMIHGMLAVRDLPQREREAWRAFFDHFVFSGCDTASHLPVAARGVLGPPSRARTAMVRDFLMRGLQRLR